MKTNRFASLLLIIRVVIAALSLPTLLRGDPDDEFRGEQEYSPGGVLEAQRSFWDGNFWRNLTHPAGPPVELPGAGAFLYFGTKSAAGVPFAEPAHELTLFTGARLGFTPPAVQPSFSRVYFGGDRMAIDGTPDVPGAPLGRLRVAAPHPIYLGVGPDSGSVIDFNRTIVEATNIQLLSSSRLILTGDVTGAGEAFNLTNTGLTSTYRMGALPEPVLLIRSGAKANLNSFSYGNTLHPVNTNFGSSSAVQLEGGSTLIANAALLGTPAGVVFDATSGSGTLTLGGLDCAGNLGAAADPLVVFKASGSALPLPPANFSVSGNSNLDTFVGVLADMRDGATMTFDGPVILIRPGNSLGLRASSNGIVTLGNLQTGNGFVPGSMAADWEANTGGEIQLTQTLDLPLHMEGVPHSFRALSGGKLELPSSLGIDTTGTVNITVSGAGSLAQLTSFASFVPFNHFSNPAAVWDHFSINVNAGGTLRGGDIIDVGGGFLYSDIRNFYINRATGVSTISVVGGTLQRVAFTLAETHTVVQFGDAGAPATLEHVSLNLGDGSFLTMRGGTWQPESVDHIFDSQQLQIGDTAGGSFALISDGAAAHSMEVRVGSGVFLNPGDPVPPVVNSTFTVNGGSAVTGLLASALFPHGRGLIAFNGLGTRGGFKNVQLGVTAFPNIQFIPPGLPGFDGHFFFTQGGDADLNVTAGAKISIGSFRGAFSKWYRPDQFQPAFLAMNASDVTIDAVSALFIGDAESEAGLAYQNGALVVSSGGYLVGTGTINGAALPGSADLVVAGGTVSPGFSPGTIHVDGGFSMSAGTLILEVRDAGPDGCDVLQADSISITGGTIRIQPADGYTPGSGFVVSFLNSPLLTIGPGVAIVIDPALSGGSFNSATGAFTVLRANDANGNGIDDRLEAVLPAAPNGQLEWPLVTRTPGAPPSFSFRRLDQSLGAYNLIVQWSTDLIGWTNVPIPPTSGGSVVIVGNGSAADSITVNLPEGQDSPQFFVRLAVEQGPP